MGLSDLVSYFQDNPYFGAGAGLFGLGAATAVLRKSLMIGTIIFKRNYTTTMEVTSRDKSYPWLLKYINERAATNTQHVSIETNFVQTQSGKIVTRQDFVPEVGEHYFWYRSNLIKCERSREQQSVNLSTVTPFEYVKLTVLGKRKALLSQMLIEAKNMVEEQTQTNTVIYTPFGSEWRVFGYPRNRRPLASVVFDGNIKEDIVADVQEFLDSSQRYIDRGIPYRKGYLLHGPPGCGKSSFISALAAHLHMGVSVLSLSDRGLTDDRLKHLMAVAPENCIILLEDIDAAFKSRDESVEVRSAYDGLSPLTFSGLLNCLDGVDSTENRLIFMTTNHIQRLDRALIRPGRVDMIREIGHCSHHQLQQMFLRFYSPEFCSHEADHLEGAELQQRAHLFAERVLSVRPQISAAEIQGYFMLYKEDHKAVMDNIEALKTSFWSDVKTLSRCG